eukprot:gene7535-572_t
MAKTKLTISGKLFGAFAILAILVQYVDNSMAFSDPNETKPASGSDLAKDAKLRIGVLHRVPENECNVKSKSGDELSMHYTGWTRKDGKVFDSSVKRGTPFEFKLGAGMVIQGWDRGLLNMCIGERRRLTIPSGLGYGDSGAGESIPGGATLVFDVELIKINGKSRDEL